MFVFRCSLLRLALITCSLSFTTLWADTIETADGSRLIGTITQIFDGVVTLETEFAGTLTIPQEAIVSIEAEALNVRLEDGAVVLGEVRPQADGSLAVEAASGAGELETEPSGITAAWAPDTRDPEQVAREEELASQIRQWSFEAAASFSMREGNAEELDAALDFKATLEGPSDRLRLTAAYVYGEADGTRTDEEIRGGITYTSFFLGDLGWYVRQELERDEEETLDLRSTTAAGLNYRFIDSDTMSLETRAGLSYRYESFSEQPVFDMAGMQLTDGDGNPVFESENNASFGLDLGLLFFWQFAAWGELNTQLNYIPSLEDFANYRVEHESTVDIPLAFSDLWKLRLGARHEYNSEPALDGSGEALDELDSTYFASLLLTWE